MEDFNTLSIDITRSEILKKYSFTQTEEGGYIVRPNEGDNDNARSLDSFISVNPVESAYPLYYNQTKESRSVYSSACSHTLNMKVRDSRYNYIELSKNTKTAYADETLKSVAALFEFTISLTKSLLTGHLELSTDGTEYVLIHNIKVYKEAVYEYTLRRQACVYDYTNLNRDVSVITDIGYGKFAIEFDENSEGKYTALGWTKVADPAFEMMSYSQYFTEAKDIWEFNMAEYGYWKWGDL